MSARIQDMHARSHLTTYSSLVCSSTTTVPTGGTEDDANPPPVFPVRRTLRLLPKATPSTYSTIPPDRGRDYFWECRTLSPYDHTLILPGASHPTLYPTNPASRRLAMLIDGDNAEAKLLDRMLGEASKHGTVTIRRIYGDWTCNEMSQWRDVANRYAFQTPHQLSYTKRKNATDTFMIIDAMDILHSGHVEGFCIVSSDSDFTGLAKRIRERGMLVIGMGRKTTPESFRKACEVFTYVEILSDRPRVEEAKGQGVMDSPQDAVDGLKAESDGKPEPQLPDWKGIVLKAIEMTAQEEWARLADVGNGIVKIDSSFDARTYGRSSLLSLVRTAPDSFEVRAEEHEGHPPVHYIRVVRE